jgi:plastocyanin
VNKIRREFAAGIAAMGLASSVASADLSLDIRDANGQPVPDAVFYAQPVEGAAPPRRANAHALIDQVNKEFVPRVSIVQAGTQVSFPNSDNIRHSIYSFSPAKTFTTKLYSGREAAPVLFDTTGLVVLGCNIHDKMVAWVFIVDTPWFGTSGADGVGTIHDIPAGEYMITAAAPSAHLESKQLTLRIESGGTVRRSMTLAAGP